MSGTVEDLAPKLGPWRRGYRLPALGAAVVDGSGLRALGAVGVRRAGTDVAATGADRWHLGSCGKAMSATVLAGLVETGRLDWSATVGSVLRADGWTPHAAWDGITLDQLLTHRGGVVSDLARVPCWPTLWDTADDPRVGRRLLVEWILERPPRGPSVGRYEYANAGYVVAGVMAEAVTGQPWERLLASTVWRPLGMETAGFGPPGRADSLDEPWGHRSRWLLWTQAVPPGPWADNPPAISPAGTVHCSLADWGRFVSTHLARGLGASSLVSAAGFARLHTPPPGQDYAMGWIAETDARGLGRVLWHNGSNTCWYAFAKLFLDQGVAVLAVTNKGGLDAEAGCARVVRELSRRQLRAAGPGP